MNKNINLKNILEKTREEALEDILKEDTREKLTKEEIYEVYKYVFLVTEKENSISKPINIPVEEISEFIKVIGETLEKRKELDFNELSIKQYGKSFILFDEGMHLNFNESIVGRYETKSQIDSKQYNYQPSNIDYARENVYYRQRRVNQMKNFDNAIPKMFLENEELFLENAKQRLEEMITQIKVRKNKKISEEINVEQENNDKDAEIISKNVNMFKNASDSLDKQFVLDIINEYYEEYYIGKMEEDGKFWTTLEENIPNELFLDEEMVLQLIETCIEEYNSRDDKDITQLKSFDFITRKMDSKLKDSPEFLKKISNAMGIVFASEEMKNNKEFILNTMKEDYWKYIYLKDEFKLDKDVIQILLEECRQQNEDIFETDLESILEEAKVIFGNGNIKKLINKDNGENKEFIELCKSIERERIARLISSTNKIVTHFGDDLDNKAAIHALECWAEDNDLIKIGHPIEVIRVPAGHVKEGFLNVDIGGHKGNRIEDCSTIVIDGEPENGIKSASEALADLGIYVPKQIIELADTKLNRVSALDSRSGLALVRELEGEQIFKLAEKRLLDKSLTDEQLEEFGLTKAHEKQQKIIDKALEKIDKYTKTMHNGEKIVLAPEQILAGSSIAYEKGVSYYASATTHLSNGIPDGVTFAITSKPGIKLPEEVLKFGQELVEKYRIDEDTSGVFVNPNGQMIVAGGFENPEFRIAEETVEGILQKIESKFTGKELSKTNKVLE